MPFVIWSFSWIHLWDNYKYNDYLCLDSFRIHILFTCIGCCFLLLKTFTFLAIVSFHIIPTTISTIKVTSSIIIFIITNFISFPVRFTTATFASSVDITIYFIISSRRRSCNKSCENKISRYVYYSKLPE